MFNFKFKKRAILAQYKKKKERTPLLAGLSGHTFLGLTESVRFVKLAKTVSTPGCPTGSLKYRMDLFLKLLAPASKFLLFRKKSPSSGVFFFSFILWPGEFLDILALILYSNPIFLNTKYFDTSAFLKNKSNGFSLVLYYVFKVPMFSTWLVIFIETGRTAGDSGKPRVLSIETLFRGAAWAERELGEPFGFFFFYK